MSVGKVLNIYVFCHFGVMVCWHDDKTMWRNPETENMILNLRLVIILLLKHDFCSVLRSRILLMRLRLRVKILMRLRLLPYCIARQNL
jgi:hypothetical protein